MPTEAAIVVAAQADPASTPRTVAGYHRLLDTRLAGRRPEDGRGWQGEHEGIVVGLHERGFRPGRSLLASLLLVGSTGLEASC
jgi:hypothetical protein